jgi:hypothetical protein
MLMWFKNIFIFIFVSILLSNIALAQKTPGKSDSTNLYKNIESYSKRSKFTKFMYRLIFRPVAVNLPQKEIIKKLMQKPYTSFEGKIIRHINIETLDPFGYSIGDTIVVSPNFFYKAGNKLHIKSQRITIKNLLLIRQNQQFDSLLVKESERLVRSQSYVRDVSFFVVATSENSDSVDISIRELDRWSITGEVSYSPSRILIQLNDKNFLGFGHEFKNAYTWYHTTGDNAYNTNYFIPNIRNTYINTTIHYGTDEFRNFTKSLAVNRPFFSPFAKWAGGVNFTQQFNKDSIQTSDSLFVHRRFKFNVQDYWLGHAIRIFKGNSENSRTTNFISAVRFVRTRYLEKPIELYDTLHLFSNENLYLASIGISTRKYVQEKYIFKYGVTEDVPIGQVYSLTGGYQVRNNTGRIYLGARISVGNYYSLGYLNSYCEYGTFFHDSHIEQGILNVGANYFTGLLGIGKWKFRQFAKAQFTSGFDRLSYESLSINNGFGIDGFNSVALSGTKRLLFTLQTQTYAPWNFIGFRFGPYLIYSLGMLGGAATGFNNNRIYSQIGLGVLIKNENLVFNTIQFSISFYPLIPGNGQDVFKTNSFKTTDFGFRDFEIGTPSIMAFQ